MKVVKWWWSFWFLHSYICHQCLWDYCSRRPSQVILLIYAFSTQIFAVLYCVTNIKQSRIWKHFTLYFCFCHIHIHYRNSWRQKLSTPQQWLSPFPFISKANSTTLKKKYDSRAPSQFWRKWITCLAFERNLCFQNFSQMILIIC